ncbi:hypothetical protein [Methylobacterium oryzae]|uniref:hypothetical protein n=1 Tax=Methylobacterium oryzae TaxID=334852 RepID=UPI003AF5C991
MPAAGHRHRRRDEAADQAARTRRGRAGNRGAARIGVDLAGEIHLLDHLGAGELLDAGIAGLRVRVAGRILQEQAAAGGHLEIGAGRDRAGRRDLRDGGARDRKGRGGPQHRGEEIAAVQATVHHGIGFRIG